MGWNDHDDRLQSMLDEGMDFEEAYEIRVDEMLEAADE